MRSIAGQGNKFGRYPVIDGKASVELKLRTPNQLFDERDPAPFRDRDLDDDAARYILASYRDLRDHAQVKVSLYFESLGKFAERPEVIEDAIHAFFGFEAEMKRRELKEILWQGMVCLMIGLTFLFTCSYFATGIVGQSNPLGFSIHEGLLVMGWVAMWRPISIFLYEWWPIKSAQNTFERLADIEVDIRPLEESAEAERRAQDRAAPAPFPAKVRGLHPQSSTP